MEQTKISAMMEGKTFTRENIDHMYQMVQEAGTPEEKTNVMKHSVFFVGQLPLDANNVVVEKKLEQQLGASILQGQMEDSKHKLLTGLATQKLLLEKDNGSYQVNTKYEKSILKVRKVARAFQSEQTQISEDDLPRVKKMYQMGTKYYNAGDYEQAAASFMNTIEMAGYRMGYYSLALMYRDGKGVDKDPEQALLYARCAIARGAVIAESLEEELLAEID
ncbi:MAG: sel1 repeat family protein [Eubacterium sp.]|nr:sel1 repeat family protein [Eubacterium sp.]